MDTLTPLDQKALVRQAIADGKLLASPRCLVRYGGGVSLVEAIEGYKHLTPIGESPVLMGQSTSCMYLRRVRRPFSE